MSKGYLSTTRRKPAYPGEGRRGRPAKATHRPPRAPQTRVRPHLIQAHRIRLLERLKRAERQGEERLRSMAAARAKKPWGKWQVGTIAQRKGLISAYQARMTRPKGSPLS